MVQPYGIRVPGPGTWLRALRASTSWKVTPANSGVRTERTRLFRRASPGRASGTSAPMRCPFHRMPTVEHTFDSRARSGGEAQRLRRGLLDPLGGARVVAQARAVGRDHPLELRLPGVDAVREGLAQHVDHDRRGDRGPGRGAEQTGDGAVSAADHLGAEL